MSHQLWQRRFRGDPGLLGKQLKLNGEAYTVVGIMKPAFQLPIGLWRELLALDDDLWVPLSSDADPSQRGNHNFQAIARLKPGVTIEQAQAEMKTIANRLSQQHPDTNLDLSTVVISLSDESVANIRPALLLLFGAVGFVLLIACVNVANLLLARALSQSREMAVRTALGASRLRLVRQLLTQSLELALVGGSAGILLAFWGTDLLLALAPSTIPRLQQAGVDSNVLCFAVLISLLTGLIFGLAPSLQGSKPDLNESLKEGGRTLAGSLTRSRLRGLLVVAETALSLVLLTSAGLLIKSFWRIESIDPGYRSENVVAMNIEPACESEFLPPESGHLHKALVLILPIQEVRNRDGDSRTI